MSDYPMLISNKLHSFRNFSFTTMILPYMEIPILSLPVGIL